jgi:hypothetical protein
MKRAGAARSMEACRLQAGKKARCLSCEQAAPPNRAIAQRRGHPNHPHNHTPSPPSPQSPPQSHPNTLITPITPTITPHRPHHPNHPHNHTPSPPSPSSPQSPPQSQPITPITPTITPHHQHHPNHPHNHTPSPRSHPTLWSHPNLDVVLDKGISLHGRVTVDLDIPQHDRVACMHKCGPLMRAGVVGMCMRGPRHANVGVIAGWWGVWLSCGATNLGRLVGD